MILYRVKAGNKIAPFTNRNNAWKLYRELEKRGESAEMMDPMDLPLNKTGVVMAYEKGLGDNLFREEELNEEDEE